MAQLSTRDSERVRVRGTLLIVSLVRDADPRPGRFGWQTWAEPVLGGPFLWCAGFSASVPHDLVKVFASSLASPHSVRRRTLPLYLRGGR
ncbi:DUF317 domain-containing protein [Streptomyces sp. NPDC056361]|uniref:DUF317 domain-containing protein n=1 Tax=Streptomyces sp. NPDC056361 TaxID=3345795 RepID=UPI0035D82644